LEKNKEKRILFNNENKEEIIKRFNNIHDNLYDYSLSDFCGRMFKIKIICPKHGIFEQTPNNHLSRNGCPLCSKNRKLTTVEVISQFKKIHENEYDYSFVDYKNDRTKIKIICPKHGIFEQKPNAHKMGSGCPKCSKTRKLTTEEVILQFEEIHKKRYDYSMVDYKNNSTFIKIICPEHGVFEQLPMTHKSGSNCPRCSGNGKLTTVEVISQFKKIHENKYDYSFVDYKQSNSNIKILCKDHGIFEQQPNNHKQNQGCPKCKTNKKEKFLINLFKEYNISYLYNNRTLIKPLEIDILIPDFKFGIEHNGLLYHSYGISNWKATDNYLSLDKNKHLAKTLKVEEQGFQLFHIREDHLLCPIKKDIWKSILLNKCGISTKVHARKLQVIDLNSYQDFVKYYLEENHLQGNCPSSIKLGLQDPKSGIVYSIMTFGKSRFDKNMEYELLRFCNLKYHNVRGAASKLMSAFEKYYNPVSIVSYANRDWSQGNLYRAIGFTYSHISEPNYIYTNSNRDIISRQQVQKHKLKNFLESRNQVFNEKISERDNMINNNYRIYYDTGNLVYHKKY
jgi:hypothetical protein